MGSIRKCRVERLLKTGYHRVKSSSLSLQRRKHPKTEIRTTKKIKGQNNEMLRGIKSMMGLENLTEETRRAHAKFPS
jgi:hypothetical protein